MSDPAERALTLKDLTVKISSVKLSTCPVSQDVELALRLGRAMTRSLRNLRESQRLCPSCPRQANCPTRQSMTLLISNAIQELADEWNLYV